MGCYNREVYAGICSADDPRALLSIFKPSLEAQADRISASMIPPKTGPSGLNTPVME